MAVLVADVGEVVTGQASVELGEVPGDQIRLIAHNVCKEPVDGTNSVRALRDRLPLVLRQGCRAPNCTVEKHSGQLKDMGAGLPVKARPLTAGIGADHAPDGGAVGG